MFVEYASQVFRQIRSFDGIDTNTYIASFGISQLDEKFNEKFSEGKSGSFFWISNDNKFIIKTMTHTESIFIRKIIPRYYHVGKFLENSSINFFVVHQEQSKIVVSSFLWCS